MAVLRFHNAVIDHLRKDPTLADQSAERIFKMAQRQVRWHYQWIILHEFLPLTIGQERVDDILEKGHPLLSGNEDSDIGGKTSKGPMSPSNFQWQPTASAIRRFVRAIA